MMIIILTVIKLKTKQTYHDEIYWEIPPELELNIFSINE